MARIASSSEGERARAERPREDGAEIFVFVSLEGTGNVLALTSWSAILNALQAEGAKAGDHSFVSDVRQLVDLCETDG